MPDFSRPATPPGSLTEEERLTDVLRRVHEIAQYDVSSTPAYVLRNELLALLKDERVTFCTYTLKQVKEMGWTPPAGDRGSPGHQDAELDFPDRLDDERLVEIIAACLRRWGAYPTIPGSQRWMRNGITALVELEARLRRG